MSRFAVTVSTSMPGMVLRLRSCRRPLTMRTVARTVTPINLDRTTLPSSLNRGEPMNAGAVARLRRFPLAISASYPTNSPAATNCAARSTAWLLVSPGLMPGIPAASRKEEGK